MIRGAFRPWGRLDWLMGHIPLRKLSILGSIATGDRSLATWCVLHSRSFCAYVRMLQIADVPTPLWGDEPKRRLGERKNEYLHLGGTKESITNCDIRDNLEDISQYTSEFINCVRGDIVIDISTLPKRFFFFIIKKILQETQDNTVVVTYTRPETYDKANPLAVDPGPWKFLPGFQKVCLDNGKGDILIVGLGYEPLGLPQFLREGEFSWNRARLLFPFPSVPTGYLRNWEFVRNLDSEVGPYSHDPIRVNGFDVSAIFDIILRESDNGKESVVFAPYGPKPMSLAMCLYASSHPENSAVYYTQPKSYNPNYSSGVRKIQNNLDILAYCIRLNGKDLYTVPNA